MAKVKDEIAVVEKNDCCNTALLSALVHSAGSISFSRDGMGVVIKSETPSVLRLAASLVKKLYSLDAAVDRGELNIKGDVVPEMLFDLGILTYYGEEVGAMAGINEFVIINDCCVKSYLKGLFLGSGSLSTASKYHLEMSFSNSEMSGDVIGLLRRFDITAHYAKRKERHIVYIKSVDAISDFLALIGASKAVLELNNTAALRYVNTCTNRRINCDLANADKVVAASMKQIDAINKVINSLSGVLYDTARVRLSNPDVGYEGLAELLSVSKSCVKYRLKKIIELAESQEASNHDTKDSDPTNHTVSDENNSDPTNHDESNHDTKDGDENNKKDVKKQGE